MDQVLHFDIYHFYYYQVRLNVIFNAVSSVFLVCVCVREWSVCEWCVYIYVSKQCSYVETA